MWIGLACGEGWYQRCEAWEGERRDGAIGYGGRLSKPGWRAAYERDRNGEEPRVAQAGKAQHAWGSSHETLHAHVRWLNSEEEGMALWNHGHAMDGSDPERTKSGGARERGKGRDNMWWC